jgi:hypothetical protein
MCVKYNSTMCLKQNVSELEEKQIEIIFKKLKERERKNYGRKK